MDIYDLETEDVLAAAELLASDEKVYDAAIFGRSIHVRLKAGINPHEYLPPILSPNNLNVNKIKAIDPTLEDVFVTLVGRKVGEDI